MDLNILKRESEYLNTVISKVSSAKETLENALDKLGAANLDRLKELRENPETGMDFLLLLEQLHEKNLAFNLKDKYRRLDEFTYLKREPFFSRIDFSQNHTHGQDTFYIGKFGYSEGNNPVITDWRSKVASVFYRYRYPQKNVSYDTPSGKVTRDLVLKRTFEIENGEMIKYFNNDIQLDESEIIIEKIEKRTGGVLEDIVETIQESQLDIIEADPRQVCIVQGCVGSGKSTVAIHKLSHVFFNYPNYIRPERSILIAKNQILVGYLSTLFPKLGIFDINYKTLRDLIVNVLYREEIKLNYNLDLNEDTGSVDIKYFQRINKDISKVHNEVSSRIERLLESPDFESFGGFKYSEKLTPTENLTDLVSDLDEELMMQKSKLKENPNAIKAWIFKENIKNLRKLINKLHKIRHDVKHKYLADLLKEHKVDTQVELGYYESVLYLYLYTELVGFKKFQKYEYAVIDEGQDFSLIEYAVLSKFVIRGRFAIFGDLNQSIESDGIRDWSHIEQAITEARKANVFTLDTNYRSTKPIIQYANSLLTSYTKEFLPRSIERKGEEPKEFYFNNSRELIDTLLHDIDQEYRDLNKSIGIISFDQTMLEDFKRSLSVKYGEKDNIIYLDSKKNIHYIPKGIYLMSAEDCKGLEFAKVYVLGLNKKILSSFSEARKAFVAVTRAMNELNIYYHENINI